MKLKKWMPKLLAAVVLITGMALWLHWENQSLGVTEIQVTCSDLPESFDGYRIAQISDLHNTEFGKDNERLITMLRQTRPDIIVLTGDLVDSRRTDLDVSIAFAAEAVKIAPTYYVTGNHEERLLAYWKLRVGLHSVGVTLMENRAVSLEKDGESITLIGIRDPNNLINAMDNEDDDDDIEVQNDATRLLLEPLTEELQGFSILLAHRPRSLDVYAECDVDLVFSGHLHGGQIRLPYIGGLATLLQGFSTGYDGGLYEKDGTQMIVSRGLGNSAFPFRINNKPEIVVATLNKE